MSNDTTTVSQPASNASCSQQSIVSDKQFERSISKWILGTIAFFFLIIILSKIAVAAGWLQGGPIDILFSSCKDLLLPIVMLILGHYFGSMSYARKQ